MVRSQTLKKNFLQTIKSKVALCITVCVFCMQTPKIFTDEPYTASFPEIQVIAGAMDYLGTPYAYGGLTKAGMDCSGFVYTVYKPLFANAPRISKDWMQYGVPIQEEYHPADILLFADRGIIFHVAIYIGDNCFIHSASQGPKTGVIISSLDEPYWKNYFYIARRLWNE